jgi:hypothetical protein
MGKFFFGVYFIINSFRQLIFVDLYGSEEKITVMNFLQKYSADHDTKQFLYIHHLLLHHQIN